MTNPQTKTPIIDELLSSVPIPRVLPLRIAFERPRVVDLESELHAKLAATPALRGLRSGARVAITAGSRGIADQVPAIRAIANAVRAAGGKPFVVPAMGSHGGATASGQVAVLSRMGLTEGTVGAPIVSSMEVVLAGRAENGLDLYFDKAAFEADGIVLFNRVKPHVSFRGRFESGLMKMIAIGLGKQRGAEICHNLGFGVMEQNIIALGRAGLATGKILFGAAVVENAYHETARVEVISADRIEAEEPALQAEAKRLEPRIPFDLDVLIIDEIGKNISGTGFDNNVVGRFHTGVVESEGPRITRMAALDITDASHGNGNGLGILDFTTRRAFDKFDFDETYPNSLTSTVPISVKIPMVLPNDRRAIQAAIKTCNIAEFRQVRLGRIKNTLEADRLLVSENLLAEAARNPNITVEGRPTELVFDEAGNLF